MNNNYESFREIIKNCDYDNTYKMAWGKSLIEMSLELDLSKDKIIIRLEDIAEKYIKYYWNQIIFFDLKQATNSNKIPTIIVIIKELIDKYYEYTNEMILEAKKNNLQCFVVGNSQIVQKYGEGGYGKFLGKKFKVTNYSPMRLYGVMRNYLILWHNYSLPVELKRKIYKIT